MEMQTLDFLDNQAQTMLGFMDSVTQAATNAGSIIQTLSTDIQTLSGNLNTLVTYLNNNDIASASALVTSMQAVITNDQTVLVDSGTQLSIINPVIESAVTLVNGLIPMITDAKREIIGDGTVQINYRCDACSIRCPKPRRFELSADMKKICELDGSKVANFVEIDRGTYQG